MNPNHSYNYSQSTPGPPQPPWQAPPRKSGWADPRFQPQPLLSPQNANYHGFGPPLPPPPDPSQQPPAQVDTSAWGVRYSQSSVSQSQDPKPPLPPRPPSATGRVSPQPGHTPAFGYQPQPSTQAQSQATSHPHGTSWGGPYLPGQATQGPTYPASAPVPPPPPPRPAAYEAEIQSFHNRVNTPQSEYSHRPPTHHYDPQQQNPWNTQNNPASVASYYPSAPAPHQAAGTNDGYLVSPIEASNTQWNQQAGSNAVQAIGSIQTSQPHVLGFGGPSDWEHYEPGMPPPEQTPTSPPPPAVGSPSQYSAPVSSPVGPAVPPAPQTPKPAPVHTPSPVEIGLASPVSRRGSHQQSPKYQVEWSQPSNTNRPSSASGHDAATSGRSDSLNSTGNIDSVIQAWTTPLRVKSGGEAFSRPESRISAASPEPSVDGRMTDPYADLAPEFKASLKRYATMLRKESAADSDEEKFEIFEAFVSKELRLRSLLYGVELSKPTKDVKKAANLVDIQAALPQSIQEPPNSARTASLDISAQPATTTTTTAAQPTVTRQPPPSDENKQSVLANVTVTSKPAASSLTHTGSEDDGEEAYSPGGRPKVGKASKATGPSPVSDSKSSASDNAVENEAYSPGGRPIITSLTKGSDKLSVSIPPQGKGRDHDSPGPISPSLNAPMVLEDYAMARPPSPGVNAPIIVQPEASRTSPSQPSAGQRPPSTPIKFEPPRPAYTPFRYSAATQAAPTKPFQPADQAYSSLRHSMVDSGRLLTQEASLIPPRPYSASGRKEHDEAFIGLIRNQSMAVRQKTPGPPDALKLGDNTVKSNTPVSRGLETSPLTRAQDPLKRAMIALRALVPEEGIVDSNSDPSVQDLKTKIEAVPDQFTFIHETVVEWDRTNRGVRRQQDAERRARQEESEAHIDALFNDNEIGYADIGDLEAEFKLAEAERRYRENQEELESFTAQVYTPVTERLQKEIQELNQAYATAMELLASNCEPVSRCLKARGGKAKMAEVMACVLTLFNKIEIRHRKLAEADVERERRRKHLELTVLYTNNDKDGMKKLEQEFAAAENAQVLHEARATDERANKLMDAFDRATVRGLGDNQMFIDDVLVKIQDLKQEITSRGQAVKEKLYEPSGARDTLSRIQDAVDLIMTDSRTLLALSNEADVLLNDADYGVSVAEARVSNAGKETYVNLAREKAKEDAKLVEEVNTRIGSVVKGPQHALDILRGMMDQIGADPEHQDRIKKALEAAKQRNAVNDPSRD
ncbi:hypothetical protein PV08_04807 [Exophiala spinifera]|uniref:Uncharacterized protein n=1 Tax=Exophiala spinifera TaxID=91928 RepID=A0A0D1ZY90_9EURO|nr:uncharacterized protein PV08_04807 [Exophiala spinifera]KIW17612.1 hypothetical protein PV08_04807 [Exophiala spinifera]